MPIAKINQAIALANKGDTTTAKQRLRKLLDRHPRHPVALYALGSVYYLEKNYEVALDFLERSLRIDADKVDALSVAAICYLKGPSDYPKTEAYVERALKLAPTDINSLLVAGDLYTALRRHDEAERAYREVLKLAPDNYPANMNLGVLLGIMGRRAEATAYFERLHQQQPQDPLVLANLISALNILERVEEMAEAFPKTLPPALGLAVFTILQISRYLCAWNPTERLVAELRNMMALPLSSIPYPSYIVINMTALSVPEIDNELLFQLHHRAGLTSAAIAIAQPYSAHEPALANIGKWRIGYLSADFRSHSVSTFLRTLVNDHDRNRFEVYCYSNTLYPDARTDEYKKVADAFVDVTGLNDRDLAERIHADGVHILVDLSGYTLDTRLTVMSYRPAPVQMIYLGYPYTSGMEEVDYIISDPYLDVPASARYFTERHLRLPESFISFGNMAEQSIAPEIPFLRNGFISFGSLNNIYKINPEVIATWARILKAVPDSRMIINHPKLKASLPRENLIAEFAGHGIGADRLQLIWEKHPDGSHFRYYNDVDIVLDCFPLSGGTTTADAIWMGVPVITLVGDLYHKRISYSIIRNIGLDVAETDSWCAHTKDDYVAKAIALAADPEHIAQLRRLIPEKLKSSVLTDPVRLVRQLEDAYIQAWMLKYPEAPVQAELSQEQLAVHPLAGDGAGDVPGNRLEIVTRAGLEDLTGYVLQEREGTWYEAEWEFAARLTAPQDRVLVIGAGPGVYALPLGRRAYQGEVLCVCRSIGEAKLLERGIARNGLTNVEIINDGRRTFRLDREPVLAAAATDLLILHGSFAKTSIFDDGDAFLAEQDPLIMFAIAHQEGKADTGLIEAFVARGYFILRLLPGLGCLAPLEDMGEIDAFCVNLFACKAGRAEKLANAGFLALAEGPLDALATVHDRDWQDLFAAQELAAWLPGWVEAPAKPANWEAYWVVLHLYARSRDPALSPARRLSNLKTACNIMLMLATEDATPWRLASLSLILEAMGWRERAVRALDPLCAALIQAPALEPEEPCLLLVDRDPGDPPPAPGRARPWLLRQAAARRERQRSHSSFFSGSADLPLLDELERVAGLPADLERRRRLIRSRFRV